MKIAPFVLAGALPLVATIGRAQDAPAPPHQAPERRLALDPASALANGPWGFTLTTFDGYDQIRADDQAGTLSAAAADFLQRSGQQIGLSPRFNVTKNHGKSVFSFAGDSTSAYYALADRMLTDANASARQSMTIGRNAAVSATESFGYAPYQSLGLFPGLDMPTGTDVVAPSSPTFEQGLTLSQVYRYSVSGQLSSPLTNRTTLSVDYQRSTTLAADTTATSRYQEIGARLLHRTSQSFGYHTGYAYAQSGPQKLHHLRIGIDGRKVLSRSRRTVFSFGTDSTLVRRPATSLAPRTEFRLLGNADLDQFIGRTWSARVSYRRDVAMIEGYAAPVFREFVTAGLAGTFNRRTTAGVNGSYVLADLPEQSTDQRDHALIGSAWFQVAIARSLTVFGKYSYYQHGFELQAAQQLNLLPQFTRNSVQAGLVLVLTPRR